MSSSENDNSSCNTSLSNSSLNSIRSDTSKSKRTRQNVALQAIAKKVEENNKQVTFQTEPIVKTIDKPQKDIKEITRPKEIQFQVPPLPIPNITKSNEVANLQNTNMSVPPPINYPQNQNYPRVNVNVGNVPFSVPFPPNTTGILYNNLQNNLPYTRTPNVPTTNTNTKSTFGFERNVPVNNLNNFPSSGGPTNLNSFSSAGGPNNLNGFSSAGGPNSMNSFSSAAGPNNLSSFPSSGGPNNISSFSTSSGPNNMNNFPSSGGKSCD